MNAGQKLGRVHPGVVEVMPELRIDLSDRRPERLSRERADIVVTMGGGDACPDIPGKRHIDWDLPAPKGGPVDDVRAKRDGIARRAEALLSDFDHEGGRP